MAQTTISTFTGRPETRAAWWSMGLGLSALAVLLGSSVVRDADVRLGDLNVGPSVGVVLGLAALAAGVVAYRRGDRSFVLWLGLLPGILIGLLVVAELVLIE